MWAISLSATVYFLQKPGLSRCFIEWSNSGGFLTVDDGMLEIETVPIVDGPRDDKLNKKCV